MMRISIKTLIINLKHFGTRKCIKTSSDHVSKDELENFWRENVSSSVMLSTKRSIITWDLSHNKRVSKDIWKQPVPQVHRVWYTY